MVAGFSLLLGACNAEQVGPRVATERFTLTAIDGNSLPAPSQFGVRYFAGSIELRGDGTFVDVIVMGTTAPAIVDSVRGTYAIDADSIRMTPHGWKKYAVKREGDFIFARWDGTFTYRRD